MSPTADSGEGDSALEGRRPIIDPCHGRRLLALRSTRLAQRPIAWNATDPYPLGDEPNPPKGASPEEVAHVNTFHFPLFRVAFAAAAGIVTLLVVHAALVALFSRSTDVLAGLH